MRLRVFKKYAIGAGGMLVLVTAILLATGWGSAVAAQVTNVFVTNDAAHPVPVHEQGTATVNLQGTAAVRSANEEVSVSHIFQDSSQFGAVCEGTLYTVPAGKQLVVEWIGGIGQGTDVQPAGSTPSGQILGNLLNIPIVWEPGFGGTSGTGVSASQPVHFTFPAGAVLTFQAAWQASTGCNFFMSLGGHLQPTP
jgi:hypothetical protein